jgi:cobalt-zinc-cadmium efflux system outer membrane protein
MATAATISDHLDLQHAAPPCVRAALVMLAALFSAGAAAQDTEMHAPLEVDAGLGWNELLTATLDNYPRHVELAARADEAIAWQRRGESWLAAAPSLTFTYLSDRALDSTGQREYQGALEMPLWYAGQRRAVRALAGSAAAESSAAAAEMRWEVAGQVRAVLWDIAAVANTLAAARDSVTIAADLVRAVERRNALGDLPLADVLLARSALFDKRKAVIEAEARLLDAERGYRSLTGLGRRPERFTEAQSPRLDFDAEHPAVALADAEVERARASLELVDRQARGNLTVSVGPRRQRDPFSILYNDSLDTTVKIPIGGERHGVADHARAARAVADAEAQRGVLLRRLDLDLHEAEHGLSVIGQSLELAAQQAALATQQRRMAETAFAQGEIELRDLLRIIDGAQAAQRDAARLEIERQRTIAAFNQALGETP